MSSELIGVYAYKNIGLEEVCTPEQEDLLGPSHGSYFFVNLISEDGPLDQEDLGKIFKKLNPQKHLNQSGLIGPFDTLDELKLFSQKVLEDFKFNSAYLVSVEEYNNSTDLINNCGDFFKTLKASASTIENKQEKKDSIFNKFFS